MINNLLDNLINLLKTDERLVSQGRLLKNKIIELALKLDKDLIALLLSDKQIKEMFFIDVNGVLIFDKDKFIKFVSNKQFLPDSYTAFKNKIGLVDEKDEFISEKKEVVLSWPYKDCVLEGGMTKEERKRDEIFWNEILAPDEISRLLDPKVFTNAKRIDKNGEHKLDNLRTDENGDIKDNLIIKGNNLLALHSLKKRFAGKVKLIYIDPPYNTGGSLETFTYNNAFNHSSWLTFIKNRLEIARDLLREDGAIIVSCDDTEQAYLKVLMDEVFKERANFLVGGVVNRPSEIASNFTISKHEYFIIYSKNINRFSLKGKEKITISRGTVGNVDQTMPVISFPAGLRCKGVKDGIYKETRKIKDGMENIENLDPIIVKNGYLAKPVRLKARWRSSNDMRKFFDNECAPVPAKIQGIIEDIYLEGDRFMPMIKKRITEKIPSLILDNKRGSKDLEEFNLEEKFKYPKSVDYTKKLLSYFTFEDDDVILDFFAGSGTTGHATIELNKEDGGNRKFILVEQLDEHIKVCKERIQKVMQKDNINNDFVYLELAKWNENFIEKIQKANTKEELKQSWETMKEKAFLSYKVDVKTIDERAKDFEDLSIENQKRFLLECLDKNHLYVNYSEIDDEEYGVNEEDKKLNKEFYGN
jgi:adenine-specific DNA-methyltransferase